MPARDNDSVIPTTSEVFIEQSKLLISAEQALGHSPTKKAVLRSHPGLSVEANPHQNSRISDPAKGYYGESVVGKSKIGGLMRGHAHLSAADMEQCGANAFNQDRIFYTPLPSVPLPASARADMLKSTFAAVQGSLGEERAKSGATAVCALVTKRGTKATITSANLGDSFQYLLQKKQGQWTLTVLNKMQDVHDPASVAEEKARLIREKKANVREEDLIVAGRGGPNDLRLGRCLQMTASFGDDDLHSSLLRADHTSHVPSIRDHEVDLSDGPAFIISASDGIEDIGVDKAAREQRILAIAKGLDAKAGDSAAFSKAITRELIYAGFTSSKPDNIGVICAAIPNTPKNYAFGVGVSDGHGELGHVVAEKVATETVAQMQIRMQKQKDLATWKRSPQQLNKDAQKFYEQSMRELDTEKTDLYYRLWNKTEEILDPLMKKITHLEQKQADPHTSAEVQEKTDVKLDALRKTYLTIAKERKILFQYSGDVECLSLKSTKSLPDRVNEFVKNSKQAITTHIIENKATKQHDNSLKKFGYILLNALVALPRLVFLGADDAFVKARTETRVKAYEAIKGLGELEREFGVKGNKR